MGIERDWNAFWEEKPYKEGGVYGSANGSLTEYAINFLDGKEYPRVLDLACGDGRYALPLSLHARVVAMDISAKALEYLARSPSGNHVNIEREEADIFDVLSQQRRYDLIICSGLIEELRDERQHILIEGLKAWIQQRGMMMLRYVIEKKLTPDSPIEVTVDHSKLKDRFKDGGWNIREEGIDPNFRQAQVGREVNGVYVRRYFRPATLIVEKID